MSGQIANYYILSENYFRNVFFNYSDDDEIENKLKNGNNGTINRLVCYVVDQLDKNINTYDILPTTGSALVSNKFKTCFEEVLKNQIQFYPAIISAELSNEVNTDFFVCNILNSISCLDKDKSDIVPLLSYLPNGPKKIKSFYLKESNLKNELIFKLEEDQSKIIVHKDFISICFENNLKGIEFIAQGNMQKPTFYEK